MAAASYYNPGGTPPLNPINPPETSPIEMGAIPAPLRPHSNTSTPNIPGGPAPTPPPKPIPQLRFDLTNPDDHPSLPTSPRYSYSSADYPPGDYHPDLSSTTQMQQQQQPPTYNPVPTSDEKPPERLSRQAFHKLRRFIKLLLAISSFTSTVINAVITGIMLFVTITYYKTEDATTTTSSPSSSDKDGGGGGERLWPPDTKTWPAWLLLIASLITLGISGATLIIYFKDKDRAGRSWKLTIAKYAVHIGVWVVVSAVYKIEQGTEDIWGWSCSEKAEAVGKLSGEEVNFGRLCRAQASSWEASIAEWAFRIVYAVGHYVLHRRHMGEKKNLADNVGDATQDLLQNAFDG